MSTDDSYKLDVEAESWLERLYPNAIPNDSMTSWESASEDVKNVLRGFVMGRRSMQ